MLTQIERFRTNSSTSKSREGVSSIDVEGLAQALRDALEGEVRFDNGSRALYATDGSNYRQVPIGVVIPRTVADVVTTVSLCRRFSAPLLSRGGGTSLAGQTCNVAVIMDFSKYVNRLLELDPAHHRARVEPGLVLDRLREAAEGHHLTFAPDPSTHNHCTLGGMIGNNSCGVHSVMGGVTADNVEELDVLTYDGTRLRVGSTSQDELDKRLASGGRQGQIYRDLKSFCETYADEIRGHYPDIPRRVSGYNLPALLPENGFHVARALVGSESTCVTVLEATLRLVHSPPVRSLLVLGYPDVYTAGDHIMEVMAHHPIGLEGMDDRLVEDMIKMRIHPSDVKLLPEGRGWLLVEFGGETKGEADDRACRLMDALKSQRNAPRMKLFDDPKEEGTIWEVRKSGLGATAHVPGQRVTWEGWEDSSVPPAQLGNYLRALRVLFDKYQYGCALYGHFGQGCVHTRIDFDLETQAGIRHFRNFLFEAADLVVSFGGSLSGEHGDGQSRAELLPRMFSPRMIEAFRAFKRIWDPDGKMNPGKLVDPYRVDDNLRLGTGYDPPEPTTHFQFPADEHSFSHATLRCVGVGECRRDTGGTMCPSYRVTREEMHSTRGRARLLFEMLKGHPLAGGWRDPHVKESLDLCLACKGCKGDCPVNVDMATYKAEFLSHYYQGRFRPRDAYSMGLIFWWARLAALAPGVANLLTQTPGIRALVKWIGGIAPERRMPPFTAQTFKAWFRRRPQRNAHQPAVILWPDTFNNHFFPETAQAAVEVLEATGHQVIVPEAALCCGRPLYDFGMLTMAKSLLRQILDTLRPEINAGTPVVGLEPSCVAVFRDELINLFPNDEAAKRLAQQTFTLAEFLEKNVPGYDPPRLRRKAIIHGHCHQKAIMKLDSERSLYGKIGLDYEVLDSGCCGMAGSFGFKAEQYQLSQQVGGLVLFPAVTHAATDTIVVADGFSCREQIAQSTTRYALHTAEVLSMALREGPLGPKLGCPETRIVRRRERDLAGALQRAWGGVFTVTGALLVTAFMVRRRRQTRRELVSTHG
jgi:FAD/FMN-containing dehydrogenase/Fe-S oxidoreductase